MRNSKFVKQLVEKLGGDYKTIVDKMKNSLLNEIEVISNTRLGYMNCYKKYYFRYVLGITEKEKRAPLQIGGAFAAGGEEMYKAKSLKKGIKLAQDQYKEGRDTSKFDTKKWQEYETALGFLEVGLDAYHREFYKDDIKRKVKTETNFKDVEIIPGYQYQATNDKYIAEKEADIIIEDKTKSQFSDSMVIAIENDGQIMGNIFSTQKNTGKTVKEVLYRVVLKPTIKRKLNETLGAFVDRAKERYDKPKNHKEGKVFELPIIVSQGKLKDFEDNLIKRITTHKFILENGLFACNYTECCSKFGNCEYLPICLGDNYSEHIFQLRKSDTNPDKEENEKETEKLKAELKDKDA